MKNRFFSCRFYLVAAVLSLFLVGTVWADGHEGGLGEKRIHVNIASVDQLIKVKGITPDIAAAIVKYREASGFFQKPEDLLKVPGITPEVYKILNPQVGTEGDLYLVPDASTDTDDDEEEEDIPMNPSKC